MNRIADLRNKANLSQSAFGKLFNAAQNTVSSWELGRREPPQDVLVQMADYFHVSIDYILGHEEQKKEKPAIRNDDGLGPLREAVFNQMRELSREDLETIQAYIRIRRETQKDK